MGSAALSLLPPVHTSSSSSSLLLSCRRRPRRRSTSHRCIVPVARLFGPAMFEASKLKVLFLGVRAGVGVDGEKHPRGAYTLTHSDITSKPVSDTINGAQDYKEAARIRDNLRSFEAEEPALHLRSLMKKAIEEERFEDAARYRDELKVVAPYSLLKCSSDATTLGIRVQVRSVYIEGRSQPLKGQYFFAYRIRITNNSLRPVQLLRRHWIITDANGKTENFWGVGVIGEQPVIHPKTGFEYSSACPLRTPNGRMEGDFEMKHIDKVGAPTFNVAIAPFSLAILGDDTESLA